MLIIERDNLFEYFELLRLLNPMDVNKAVENITKI